MHQPIEDDRLDKLERKLEMLEANMVTFLAKQATLLKVVDQMLEWMEQQEDIKIALQESTLLERSLGRLDS
jgi:hypothetical protein